MGPGDLREFQAAGKALFSLGLVGGSEGNLSTFDGERLRITRTGCRLADLVERDVLEGTLDDPPQGASSDLAKHLELYRERGPGAVLHAHPAGSVPEGWKEGEPHGVYVFDAALDTAVATAVGAARHRWSALVERVRPVRFEGDRLVVIDQTRLPQEEAYLELRSVEEVADAIRRLAVRGAPVLGIAAAYGLALAAARGVGLEELEAAKRLLAATRPTAVNIRWAVDRVLARAGDAPDVAAAAAEEARRIEEEDAAACAAMGAFGADLVPEGANVLTHCNTGMLCTAGIGTALGVIVSAHRAGKGIHVWVDETRPVLQGARLTAWELQRLGIPMTLVADTAAGSLMSGGKVDLVVVGADRIAACGDVANKVGTYALAVLARRHGVPFYVVAPTSTVDLATASGEGMAIEERDPSEVTHLLGARIAPEGVAVANPAFDVTPAELVTAIVTERGVVRPPYADGLREALEGERA